MVAITEHDRKQDENNRKMELNNLLTKSTIKFYSSIPEDSISDQMIIWQKKRKITTYIIYVYALIYGTEYSAIVLSLYYYLENFFPIGNIELYYCLTMTAMSLSATVTSIILGYYVDKKRDLRVVMLIIIPLAMLGNLLYSLYFSVWLVIGGRLLCGLGEAIITAGTGELARMYVADEFAPVMYRLQTLYTIGFVMGPAINGIFLKVDFNLSHWHINKYNFIGLFLMFVLAICYVATIFGVSNLSYPPSESGSSSDVTKQNNGVKSVTEPSLNSKISVKNFSSKVILTTFSIMLIVVSSALLNYGCVISELVVPIIANSGFEWGFTRLTIVITVCVAIFILVSLVLEKHMTKGNRRIYTMYISCLLLSSVSLSVVIAMKYASTTSLVIQTFLICTATLINSTTGLTALSMAKILFLQMVPTQWASYSEGIRGGIYRCFGLVGYVSGGIIVPYLQIFVPIVITGLVTASVLFIMKKNMYEHILNNKSEDKKHEDLRA